MSSDGSFRRYYIMVEGGDDSDLANSVIVPVFSASMNLHHCEVVEWAQYSKEKRKSYMASIRSIGCGYTIITDQDGVCVSVRRKKMIERQPYLEPQRIVVVRGEIEAWYLAGASAEMLAKLGVSNLTSVDGVTKEAFQRIVSAKRLDEALAKIDLLASYDTDIARSRSASFEYLLARHGGA